MQMQKQLLKKKISGYTIYLNQLLGKGSFSQVYKAQQEETGKICAVKMISKKIINNDQYLKKAIFSEIEVLRSVKNQNIIQLYDVLESSHHYYVVQQLCDSDLDKLLRSKGGKLHENQAIAILKQICNGFISLVRQGFIHRDLKPANIFIVKNVIKIGDFGFAKRIPNQKIKNQSAVGTPLYMCSQILKAQNYTSKCDIWGLGVIFYQILHGDTPWTGVSEFELVTNIENKPLKINQNLRDSTKDFLKKTLQKKQKDRISWDQLFIHQIFENCFYKFIGDNKHFQNKMKIVMHTLRYIIQTQKIDVKTFFEKVGYGKQKQLNFQQLHKLLKLINPHIKSQETVYIFEKLDTNNSNSISVEQLENQLQKNSLIQRNSSNQICLPEELEKKINTSFCRLYKILSQKNVTLSSTFILYDKDKNGSLQIDQFSKMMIKLDPTFTKQQIQQVFNLINEEKSQSISFNQFNAYFCKVNKMPFFLVSSQSQKVGKNQ